MITRIQYNEQLGHELQPACQCMDRPTETRLCASSRLTAESSFAKPRRRIDRRASAATSRHICQRPAHAPMFLCYASNPARASCETAHRDIGVPRALQLSRQAAAESQAASVSAGRRCYASCFSKVNPDIHHSCTGQPLNQYYPITRMYRIKGARITIDIPKVHAARNDNAPRSSTGLTSPRPWC